MKDDERDDRGRDVFENGAAGVERELRRLAPMAVPPGLRGRVIARAAEARRGALVAPWMRVFAVACSVLIAIVLVTDPLIGRHEEARLAALLDGRPSSRPTEEEVSELAEILAGQGNGAYRIVRLRAMVPRSVRCENERDFIEARKRLKGWLEDETSESPH